MTGAVQTPALAADWLKARGQKAANDNPDARSWLDGQGINFTSTLNEVVAGAYTDGYVIGQQSGLSLVTGSAVDWGSWSPGDEEAAAEVLGEEGKAGLESMLQSAGVTIRSINSNRLDELAQALADALENGDTADTLAKTLTDVLDSPSWAYMVAQTELTRAVSAASQSVYQRHNVASQYWLTAEDERVCPVCADNEDQGAVPLDQNFSSGDAYPPAHPQCRCALAPAVDVG